MTGILKHRADVLLNTTCTEPKCGHLFQNPKFKFIFWAIVLQKSSPECTAAHD